ncbi:hypothetical protein MBRU_16745 [Mycolicibacterium brumae DSM 44177]|nr:hypothetical protein MBRU_16745 [Mycolicibacterium brumae DSM 44177]
MSRTVASENPRFRAVRMALVTRRLRSHSAGAAAASSKSFRSNTMARSGAANTPKLDRWASPQHITSMPVVGLAPRSAAITAAAPR